MTLVYRHNERTTPRKGQAADGTGRTGGNTRRSGKGLSAPLHLLLVFLLTLGLLCGCGDDNGGSAAGPEQPGDWGGEDCTALSYARYGDYLSTQMVTNRTFGYGLYVCEFQAADGPTCSTFWLYADEPSVRNLPDTAQNWRWNEIDFEFVPFTEATQSQYYTFAGGLPRPAVEAFGTTLNFGDPRSQRLEDDAVSWTRDKIQTDETIARDMWLYYNTWMTTENGGPPTGGHFILRDALSNSETPSLNLDITEENLKKALDDLNGGQGLFGDKGHYTVAKTASSGKGDIREGSLNMIRNLDAGLVPQLSPGAVVHAVEDPVEDPSVIEKGTTILATDTAARTVTLSRPATKAVTGQTFQFVSVGSWSITFTGDPPDPSEALVVDPSGLEPPGTLGKVVVGVKPDGEIQALSVSVFQPSMKPLPGGTWWDLLKNETGDGKTWINAQDWKYPLVHVKTPDALDMKKMVTLNFWRSPQGNESADISFGDWGTVTHRGILRERPIPGTGGRPASFTSAVLNNEAYVFDSTGSYDPTGSLHTYTIVWTPTRMAQYIDAPDRGRDIANAIPVTEYRIKDFPSLDHSGPQAEGADVPWIGTELNQPIGNVTMNVANYVAFRAASAGTNAGRIRGNLAAGSATVQNVAFEDLPDNMVLVGKGVTGRGIPPGTAVHSVDRTGKTLTMNKAASSSMTGSCLTVGQEILKLNINEGDAILRGFDLKKDETVSDKVAVGQIVLGDGIPDGATVKSIDVVGKTATMTLGAQKTQTGADLVFQTAPSGSGWSGPPPGTDFTAADAYVRSLGFFPLTSRAEVGTAVSDFLTDPGDPDVFWLDFSDGTWTAENFNSRITKYFGILYAQDYTRAGAIPGKSPLRDAKSPENVTYETLSDGHGAMRLRCSLSQEKPARNFFVLQPKQAKDDIIGPGNPLVRAEISSMEDAARHYAASSSVTTPSAFYGPPPGESVTVLVKVWVSEKGFYDPDAQGNPIDPAPDYEAEILLKADNDGALSWKATEDTHGVIEAFQSKNPHLITVKAP